jgi:hypothetical protein
MVVYLQMLRYVLLLPDTLDEHGDDALRGDGFGTR